MWLLHEYGLPAAVAQLLATLLVRADAARAMDDRKRKHITVYTPGSPLQTLKNSYATTHQYEKDQASESREVPPTFKSMKSSPTA